MQQLRGLSLIAATLVQRSPDQFNLVAFDLVVEVDAAINRSAIVLELSFQRSDLVSESFCQRDELIDLHVRI